MSDRWVLPDGGELERCLAVARCRPCQVIEGVTRSIDRDDLSDEALYY